MKKLFRKLALCAVCIFMIAGLAACMNKGEDDSQELAIENGKFPAFTSEGFDGMKYSESMFKDNAVTVLNFWFTECTACISEMPELEKLSKEWETKNVKLVGVWLGTMSKDSMEEAKKVLNDNSATYLNLSINSGGSADKLLNSIMAFPTTLLVDREGNVIGKPIVGSINSKEQIELINKRIDEIISKDSGK